MKTVNLFLFFIFYSVAYSQSDEIKLLDQNEPLIGKIILIKPTTVQFIQNSNGLLFEFDRKDINYLKSENGDTIWFNILNNYKNTSENINIKNTGQNISLGNRRATIFFSYNFLGKYKLTTSGYSGNPDVNSGISVGLDFDFIKSKTDIVLIGLGAIYQFSRKQINTNGAFSFVPLYAFFKLGIAGTGDITGFEKIKIYLVPAFGYNFFYGDKKYSGGAEISGGFYNSFGFGILVNRKLDLKLLYQFNRGCIETADKKNEVLYRSLDLHCGYYF